jgi:hypothetical protein
LYYCQSILAILRFVTDFHRGLIGQLALAQKVGLEIPPTLMTNDPQEAREFSRQHNGDIIYKQFLALPDAWCETRRLRPEEAKLIEAAGARPIWRLGIFGA